LTFILDRFLFLAWPDGRVHKLLIQLAIATGLPDQNIKISPSLSPSLAAAQARRGAGESGVRRLMIRGTQDYRVVFFHAAAAVCHSRSSCAQEIYLFGADGDFRKPHAIIRW